MKSCLNKPVYLHEIPWCPHSGWLKPHQRGCPNFIWFLRVRWVGWGGWMGWVGWRGGGGVMTSCCTCTHRWCYAKDPSRVLVVWDDAMGYLSIRHTSMVYQPCLFTNTWGLIWYGCLCALHGLCQRQDSSQPGICRYIQLGSLKTDAIEKEKTRDPQGLFSICTVEKREVTQILKG